MARHMSVRWLASTLGVHVSLLRFIAPRVNSYYRHWAEPKPAGGFRHLSKTIGDLRMVQGLVASRLLKSHPVPDLMHGCVKGRSPLTNAKEHTDKSWVVSLDVENFYPSVTAAQVFDIFRADFGLGPPIASILTTLCTFEGRLPQGIPTSGFLANLAIAKAARKVGELASGAAWVPTLYVDDISASGDDARKAMGVITHQVERAGFRMKREKTKVMPRGGRQVICGYNVDRRQPSVPLEKRARIRCAINEVRMLVARGADTSKAERSIRSRIAHVNQTNKGSALRLTRYLEKTLTGSRGGRPLATR